MEGARPVRAPRGTTLTARSWAAEAPLRMLMNNLDPEVAERPEDLVVYGGRGQAARDWRILRRHRRAPHNPRRRRDLLVQSGKPGRRRAAPTRMRRASSSPTPTWCRTGPPRRTSTTSSAAA